MATITHEVDALVVITEDPQFPYYLDMQIQKIEKQRREVSGQLKRHPVDYLQERDMFNRKALMAEFLFIRKKSSKLPSTVRSFVEWVVKVSIYEFISKKQKKATACQEKKPVTSSKRKTAKKAGPTIQKD